MLTTNAAPQDGVRGTIQRVVGRVIERRVEDAAERLLGGGGSRGSGGLLSGIGGRREGLGGLGGIREGLGGIVSGIGGRREGLGSGGIGGGFRDREYSNGGGIGSSFGGIGSSIGSGFGSGNRGYDRERYDDREFGSRRDHY